MPFKRSNNFDFVDFTLGETMAFPQSLLDSCSPNSPHYPCPLQFSFACFPNAVPFLVSPYFPDYSLLLLPSLMTMLIPCCPSGLPEFLNPDIFAHGNYGPFLNLLNFTVLQFPSVLNGHNEYLLTWFSEN